MRIQGRYEIRDIIGEGGMGIVYRAEDLKLRAEVAIKTIRNPQDPASFELFKKECEVLSKLNHANIIDIRDFGEYDDNGVIRPYLVMPLLAGMTLDKVIEKHPGRLTPERVVDMMVQACRGLQAAHDKKLIHRDLKPSNVFVSDDDTIKIIDFGIAHLVDQRSTVGGKGTPYYMSPEQISMGKLSPESDIFSLGVICFETLTKRKPFGGVTLDDIFHNILHVAPPSASEFNPAVPQLLSQVIHLAMAKQPNYRYGSAREFAECLQKGVRNEPIDRFDPATLAPRLRRIQRALNDSDYEDALEMLNALEAEGYLHPETSSMRKQANLALRTRRVNQLLESARRYFERQEYELALDKLQQVFAEEPNHPEGIKLREAADEHRRTEQYNKWITVAEEHLQNFSFARAREAAERARNMETTERAIQLLADIDTRERKYQEASKEKERLFQSVAEHKLRGELTQAVEKVQRLISLNNLAPEKTPDRGAAYENLFNEVRTERDAFTGAINEAKRLLKSQDYAAALAVCDEFLVKYPNHPVFNDLRLEVGERQQRDLSEFIAKVESEAGSEPDLDRRVAIYEKALERYPDEPNFARALRIAGERREAIYSHAHSARNKEERGQYAEAVNHWETLKALYPNYPGLEIELDRARRRLEEQQREEERSSIVAEIRRRLAAEDLVEAAALASGSLADSPNDPEIKTLSDIAARRLEKATQAASFIESGRAAIKQNNWETAIKELRTAHETGERQALAKALLIDALVSYSRSLIDTDAAKAAELAKEAYQLDANNPKATAQFKAVSERDREQQVTALLNQVRNAQDRGDSAGARSLLEKGAEAFPQEPRLAQYWKALREADFEKVKDLRQSLSQAAKQPEELKTVIAEIQSLTSWHKSDPRFLEVANLAGQESARLEKALASQPMAAAAAASAGHTSHSPGLPKPAPVLPSQASNKPVEKPVAPATKPDGMRASAIVPPAEIAAALNKKTPRKAVAPLSPPVKSSALQTKLLVGMLAGLTGILGLLAFFVLHPNPPAPKPQAAVPSPRPVEAQVLPAVPQLPTAISFEVPDDFSVEFNGKQVALQERKLPVTLDAGSFPLTIKDRAMQMFKATLVFNPDSGLTITAPENTAPMFVTVTELKGTSVRVFGPKLADVTKWTDAPIHDAKSILPGESVQLELPSDASKIFVAYYDKSPYEVPLYTADGEANKNLVKIHVYDTSKGAIILSGLPAGAVVTCSSTRANGAPLKGEVRTGRDFIPFYGYLGKYSCQISAKGRKTLTQIVEVQKWQRTIPISLATDLGSINVSGAVDAVIFLDGAPYKKADSEGTLVIPDLEPKSYRIQAKKGDVLSDEGSVTVQSGRPKDWRPTFKQVSPAPARVAVDPTPVVAPKPQPPPPQKPVKPSTRSVDLSCFATEAADGGYKKIKSGSCGPFPGRFGFDAKWRKLAVVGVGGLEGLEGSQELGRRQGLHLHGDADLVELGLDRLRLARVKRHRDN